MASFEQTIFFKQRLNQAVAQRLSSIGIYGVDRMEKIESAEEWVKATQRK
ncbi:MAG: hypothetical protein IIX45_05950 [Lachnospiraceae bacterium]|nr:hypothetical protein [Lachnospiraceae bacterium]